MAMPHPVGTTQFQGLIQQRTPVDYARIIGDARVTYLGEIHHRPAILQEVSAMAPLLKELGFTHIAMETFLTENQGLLDIYCSGPPSALLFGEPIRDVLVDMEVGLHKEWCEVSRRSRYPQIPPAPSVYPPYLDAVDIFVVSGLKVLGTEWFPSSPYTFPWGAELYDKNFQDKFLKKAMPHLGISVSELDAVRSEDGRDGKLMSEAHHAIFEGRIMARNWHAASLMKQILDNPNHKIAFLGGRKHFGYMHDIRNRFALNRLIAEKSGLRGPVIYFSVPETESNVQSFEESSNVGKMIFDEADEMGLAGERFMVPVERQPDMDTPDYVVHLPAP